MSGPEPIPPLRERLRNYRPSVSGAWVDAELLCILAADGVSVVADAVEWPLRRLGGRCHRNARAAYERAQARS